MADWERLSSSSHAHTLADVMSLYTTQSDSTPLYAMNGHASELNFTSPMKSVGDVDEDNNARFCHNANIEQCIASINQEITTLGMRSLYSESSTYDIVRLINCTHELLQKHRQSSRVREELENREHRLKVDIDHTKAVQDRLKLALEKNERDLAHQQERERQQNQKLKLLNSKLKAEKEEVKRLQSSIAHREQQYRHEAKKKERELLKLKERLNQHLTDKTERRIGLELSDPLIRSDGKRGVWKTGNKQEEELYRGMISGLEERQQQLVLENTELRQFLRFMQQALSTSLASNTSLSSRPSSKTELSEKDRSEEATEMDDDMSDVLSEAHFEMPFDVVRDDIQRSVQDTIKQVQRRLEREEQKGYTLSLSSDSLSKTDSALGATSGTVVDPQQPANTATVPAASGHQSKQSQKSISEDYHLKETEKLQKQIARYKDIIEQQEALLQEQLETQTTNTGDDANTSILQHSVLLEEQENLQAREKLFKEQQANFEKERVNFTEAAIRLAKERKELDEKKAQMLADEFLNLTPFRDTCKPADNKNTQLQQSPVQINASMGSPELARSAAEPQLATSAFIDVTSSNTVVTSPESPQMSRVTQLSHASTTPTSSDGNECSDAAKSDQSKRPRSRRMLPPTPSAKPEVATSGGVIRIGQHEAHISAPSQPLATPRVMARPHSSIAISGNGQSRTGSSSNHGRSGAALAPKVLRPRSSASSTAELYKKLGLEPPKDRGRKRERQQRVVKPSGHDVMERYPGGSNVGLDAPAPALSTPGSVPAESQQPGQSAAAVANETAENSANDLDDLHTSRDQSASELKHENEGNMTSRDYRSRDDVNGTKLSRDHDNSQSRDHHSHSSQRTHEHVPSRTNDTNREHANDSKSSRYRDYRRSSSTPPTSLSSHETTPTPHTQSKAEEHSSSNESKDYDKRVTKSSELLLSPETEYKKGALVGERYKRGDNINDFRPVRESERNRFYLSRDSSQVSLESEKGKRHGLTPKLGQKYSDRRKNHDTKYRRDRSTEEYVRKYEGGSSESIKERHRKDHTPTHDRDTVRRSAERLDDHTEGKSGRSLDDIRRYDRPKSGHNDKSKYDSKTTGSPYLDRQDTYRSERSYERRLDRSREDQVRSDRSRDELSDKDAHRRSKDKYEAKERHSSRERRSSRDRSEKHSREHSRDRKLRGHSKDQSDRNDYNTREPFLSERSGDYNSGYHLSSNKSRDYGKEYTRSRPGSGKSYDRANSGKSYDRSNEDSRYSARERYNESPSYLTSGSHREYSDRSEVRRPHTARDSYVSRQRSIDGSMSARDPEPRVSSLRREASFDVSYKSRDRHRDLDKDAYLPRRSASTRERGSSSDHVATDPDSRRRAGGSSYPVAALILRNPETHAKSGKR